MTLKDFINSQGLSMQEFKNLDKSTQKQLRKMHEDKNKEEQIENTKILQARYKEVEANRQKDTTDEEIYRSMYQHLYEIFGPHLNRHDCSGQLKLTRRYLNKYCKAQNQYNRLIDYIKEHGGCCDCEVLLNCPHDMMEVD